MNAHPLEVARNIIKRNRWSYCDLEVGLTPGGNPLPYRGDQLGRLCAEVLREMPDIPTAELETAAGAAIGEYLERRPLLLGKRADRVAAEKVNWFWEKRIACGTVTIIQGDPGFGKSTLTVALAAHATTGSPWPDGAECPIGNALQIGAEDSPEMTIRPRLEAAGADLSRVRIIEPTIDAEGTLLTLPDHLAMIEETAREFGAIFIVFDPLNAFLAGQIDGHKDQHIRRALAPIAAMAARLKAAIVIIRHLNKGGGSNVLYRGQGSIGLTAAARAEFLVAPDPDDPEKRIFACSKNNLAPKPESLAFRLMPVGEVARVEWLAGSSPLKAEDLLGDQNESRGGTREAAKEFLAKELLDGPVPVTKVFQHATEIGISEKTVRRAADDLKVRKDRESRGSNGDGRWTWSLLQDAQDGQTSEAGHLANDTSKNSHNNNGNLQDAQDGQVSGSKLGHLADDREKI